MKASTKTLGMISAGVAAAAVVGIAAIGSAQDGPPVAVPPPQGEAPRPRNMPMPPNQFERPMAMVGGPALMIDDQEFLYILRGNMIYKVSKGDLALKSQAVLPMGPPPSGRGEGFAPPQPGQPGRPRGQGGR